MWCSWDFKAGLIFSACIFNLNLIRSPFSLGFPGRLFEKVLLIHNNLEVAVLLASLKEGLKMYLSIFLASFINFYWACLCYIKK